MVCDMKKLLMAVLALAGVSLTASAQKSCVYSYEGDGFYVRLVAPGDLRIGSISDMRFATEKGDDDERKVEVEVCKGLDMAGYSQAMSEIDDADFFINDGGTEMMCESARATRHFLGYMRQGESSGVSLKVYVADPQSPKGRSVKYLEVPAKAVSGFVSARCRY